MNPIETKSSPALLKIIPQAATLTRAHTQSFMVDVNFVKTWP